MRTRIGFVRPMVQSNHQARCLARFQENYPRLRQGLPSSHEHNRARMRAFRQVSLGTTNAIKIVRAPRGYCCSYVRNDRGQVSRGLEWYLSPYLLCDLQLFINKRMLLSADRSAQRASRSCFFGVAGGSSVWNNSGVVKWSNLVGAAVFPPSSLA